MPSKYQENCKRNEIKIEKQDASLPYKQHYKSPKEMEMCPNCGYEMSKGLINYSKCHCGGTFQSRASVGINASKLKLTKG